VAGINVTYVDTHMLTAALPPFSHLYVEVALEHHLPLLLLDDGHDASNLPELPASMIADPLLPLGDPHEQVAAAKNLIDTLRPGLTMLILHPARDTPELRALAPDWPSRVANCETVLSGELRDHIRHSGVQVIGYRPLRELLRASS